MKLKQNNLSIVNAIYTTLKGKQVYKITLKNDDIEVTITNLGSTITSIITPDRKGIRKNIVAGFDDILMYENNLDYFGCIVGRFANRIAGGKFTLDGKAFQLSLNDGINHLHGGFEGFQKKIWNISSEIREEGETGVVFEYLSRDGEEGYPGNLQVKVKYILNDKNQLIIQYHAVTDKRTPVNLTSHSYFNLTGFENPVVLDHILHINALNYTEKNEKNIPTGNILPLAGTPLDFLQPKRIGININKMIFDKGYDHNYILNRDTPGEIVLAAELKEPEIGRILRIFTDRPSIQLYTGNYWNGLTCGAQGKNYVKYGAVALETQAFPDSPNHENFPNTILDPGNVYHSTTIYEFDRK